MGENSDDLSRPSSFIIDIIAVIGSGELVCERCPYRTRSKRSWLGHQKQRHTSHYNDLLQAQEDERDAVEGAIDSIREVREIKSIEKVPSTTGNSAPLIGLDCLDHLSATEKQSFRSRLVELPLD